MCSDVVLLDIDRRGVATVTLNRPAVNNAYDDAVIAGLAWAVNQCAENSKVRLVLLRANGKHFQAGADLKWLQETAKLTAPENVEVSRRTAMAVHGLNVLPKPTLALVHGGCFGGGAGIVAACDVVIASEDAIFAITEARWGVMAGIIIPHLNAAMGMRNVRRYALTCERFDAVAAQSMGLVHMVCPKGDLDTAAAPVIDQLLSSAPEATAQTKHRVLETAGLMLEDETLNALIVEHSEKRQSSEASEGLASFVQKRKPAWFPED